MNGIGFHSHDHKSCIFEAVKAAEEQCCRQGLQLTPVRKRSLEILLEEHRAMRAYDLLDRLAKDGFGSQPPVAYRALEFLTNNGFVHKIEKLNAFIACTHRESGHMPVFLICSQCERVSEIVLPEAEEIWSGVETTSGFSITTALLEIEGVCAACKVNTDK